MSKLLIYPCSIFIVFLFNTNLNVVSKYFYNLSIDYLFLWWYNKVSECMIYKFFVFRKDWFNQ